MMTRFYWAKLFGHLMAAVMMTSAFENKVSRRNVAIHPDTISSPTELTEYCEWEPFQPRCSADHVVQITEARYGLVSLGRCLTADYGYIGCYADVIDYVSNTCSGRRFCRLVVPDKFLSTASTMCRPEFKSFLLAGYKCLPVSNASSCRSCNSDGVVRVNAAGSDGSGGYIASVLVAERQDDNGCGGPRCPWVLEAQPGQVINLTLYEFNTHHSRDTSQGGSPHGSSRPRGSSGTSDPCPGFRFAVIKERANPRDFSVCGGGHVTGRHVFTSVSNTIELQVVSAEALSWKLQFVIRYQAVGCADISPPANGWSRRIEGRMEMGCTSSERHWALRCVDNKWTGDVTASCTSLTSTSSSSSSFNVDHLVNKFSMWYQSMVEFTSSVPLGILVTTVASIVLVLLVIIITCCCVCIKRRRYKTQYRPPAVDHNNATYNRHLVTAAGSQSEQYGCGKMLYQPHKQLGPNTLCKVHHYPQEESNKYVCNEPKVQGQGVLPMDVRPLPSLPRRPGNHDNTDTGCVAGSLRSNASGSHASLHWGDTPPRPETTNTDQSAWLRHSHVTSAGPEDDYLVPRTLQSTQGSPSGLQTSSADLQRQALFRQHPQLMARASFPVVMATEGQLAPWAVVDSPCQTMPHGNDTSQNSMLS